MYNIPIGFSDFENEGVDTKFVFLGWPKTEIGAIQCFERYWLLPHLAMVIINLNIAWNGDYKSSFML